MSLVLPNFQSILPLGEVGKCQGATRTRIQKIGVWGLGFRFLFVSHEAPPSPIPELTETVLSLQEH